MKSTVLSYQVEHNSWGDKMLKTDFRNYSFLEGLYFIPYNVDKLLQCGLLVENP